MCPRFIGLALSLLAAGVLHAAEPCAEMVRLHRAHATHAGQADSDPATLNRLLTDALAARDECFGKYRWSKEVEAAVEALSQPVYVVPATAITSSEPRLSGEAYEHTLFADIPGHGQVHWGVASMPCKRVEGRCFNEGAASPNMYIDTRVIIGGRAATIQIRGEENKRLPATTVALRILNERFQQVFGRPLAELSGTLIDQNLAHFQQEFAERRYKKNQSLEEAGQGAIRSISFGKHRMAPPFGYRTFEVKMDKADDWQALPLKLSGDREAVPYRVPGRVEVIAKDRSL